MEDRDITLEEVERIQDEATEESYMARYAADTQEKFPTRKAYLMTKCSCGRVAKISEDVIDDGLSWSMIVGNEHFLTLRCDECGSEITMYLEEILEEDELSQEGDKE
jgi:hypothetical protein